MGGVRWAFQCGSWTPTRPEWLQCDEKDRIGKLVLRRLVCDRMGVPWADIGLERSPRGKPYLANPACSSPEAGVWSSNTSHQGDCDVLAAEHVLQVGVDVMKTTMPGSSSVPEFFHIMTRQFTVYEWSVIR
ncbi:unnamed protein product [Coregonus sp. 'balchen']|nr:unnamed protein product [Coregonus sp. 'balchen']